MTGVNRNCEGSATREAGEGGGPSLWLALAVSEWRHYFIYNNFTCKSSKRNLGTMGWGGFRSMDFKRKFGGGGGAAVMRSRRSDIYSFTVGTSCERMVYYFEYNSFACKSDRRNLE